MKRFRTSTLLIGVLTIAALMQTVPAEAKNDSSRNGSPADNSSYHSSSSIDLSSGSQLSIDTCLEREIASGDRACLKRLVCNEVKREPNLFDQLKEGKDQLDFDHEADWLRTAAETKDEISKTLDDSENELTCAAIVTGSGTGLLSLSGIVIPALLLNGNRENESNRLFDPTRPESPSNEEIIEELIDPKDRPSGGQDGVNPRQPIPSPALVPHAMGVCLILLRRQKQQSAKLLQKPNP